MDQRTQKLIRDAADRVGELVSMQTALSRFVEDVKWPRVPGGWIEGKSRSMKPWKEEER